MKLSLLVILFFSVILNASYIRSIRIASFSDEKEAKKSLLKLKSFVSKHDNIVKIKNSNHFEEKYIKSGKYLLLVIEPLTNRKAVQEILDTLRTKYKGAYAKKIKFITKSSKPIVHLTHELIPKFEQIMTPKIIDKKVDLQEHKVIDVIKKKDIKIEDFKPKDKIKAENIIVEVNKTFKVPEVVTQENKKLSVLTHNIKEQHIYYDNVWVLVSIIMLILMILSIIYIYKLRREREIYINRDIILNEKLNQLNVELKNKDKFLAHSSHELRTPMTAIMGLTYLVLENSLSDSQRVYIKNIQNSAEYLLRIINDILDISKIESGELRLEKKDFNINSIFDYVLNIVAIKIKDNSININMNIDSDIPSHIIGDSLRLGQILINLLSNAVKFTKEGSITLGVKKLSNFGETILLEFSISDTGIGMSEEELKNIFSPYTQANSSTSRKFGGTGLGLSISKQLVEMMDGNITVKSKKDVGTTFAFTSQFKLKDSQNKRQYRLPSRSYLNKKILIVDSIKANVISLISAFGYFNYKTHAIPSFEEAILEDNMKFNIIVINQNNLTKLAIEKITKIKLNSDNKLKLVILSELHSSLNVEMLKKLDVGAYLKTPFTQQSILNMIIELYVVKNLNKYSRKKSIKDKLKEITGKKILVAEDNILNHKVIAGLLDGTGIKTTFVINGREAVELLEKGIKFDLILMDINMPVLNGYEATKEIRKNKKYNNIPIIALTADVMKEAIEEAFAVGMQGHIAKPIIIDIFYSKILNILTSPVKIENNKLKVLEDKDDGFNEITISVGLSRCDNDINFYKSILKDFKVMYKDSANTLENLCKVNQFKEARQISIDIKDVALNLGAYNICESSAAMEYEFEKGSRGNWKKLISFYKVELDKLFLEIDKYLK